MDTDTPAHSVPQYIGLDQDIPNSIFSQRLKNNPPRIQYAGPELLRRAGLFPFGNVKEHLPILQKTPVDSFKEYLREHSEPTLAYHTFLILPDTFKNIAGWNSPSDISEFRNIIIQVELNRRQSSKAL